MTEQSTEQQLREALRELIEATTFDGEVYYSAIRDRSLAAIRQARAALALRDSGHDALVEAMSEKSTEQVLREALRGLQNIGRKTVYDDDMPAYTHALDVARAALALPDSGDHEIAESLRATRNNYVGLPPTDERIELLARDLRDARLGVIHCLESTWENEHEDWKEAWRETTRRFLAKHPEMVRAEAPVEMVMFSPSDAVTETRYEDAPQPPFVETPSAPAEVSPSCAAKLCQDLTEVRAALLDCISPAPGETGTPVTQDFIFGIVEKINVIGDALRLVRDAAPERPQPDTLADARLLPDAREKLIQVRDALLTLCYVRSRATASPTWTF